MSVSRKLLNGIAMLHDHRPYEKGDVKGRQMMFFKRTILALILAIGVAVAAYYINQATAKVWNPYKLGPTGLKNFSITSTVLTGLLIFGLGSYINLSLIKKSRPAN